MRMKIIDNGQSIIGGTVIVICFCFLSTGSWALPNHDIWQTGTLVKRDALAPPKATNQPAKSSRVDALFARTIYTVDSPNYTYQFLGFAFSFPSPTLSTITFTIAKDGTVRVRDPKSKYLIELTLLRKFAGPDYRTNISPTPNKLKHRQWVRANVTEADPTFFPPVEIPWLVLSPSPIPGTPLLPGPASWTYTVEVQGKSYVLYWRHPQTLNITIHGTIEFALGKRGSAYLIDDNGKERKLRIEASPKKP